MPQSRPEFRKSKWEKAPDSQSEIKLNKPLVEYESFSSTDDEQAKEHYAGETRRRVVLKSVPSEKLKTSKNKRSPKSDSQKSRSESHKSRKSGNRRTSTDRKEDQHNQKEAAKEKLHKKYIKDKSKIDLDNNSKKKLKSSVKKLPKKRSRSKSVSFTDSDLSNDSMDRHMPLSHGAYDRRQYSHNSTKDSYVNHRPYQPHSQNQSRYGRGRSPVASNYAPVPRVPIRRSISPPRQQYSPSRRKDVYHETQFSNHDSAQSYQNRSRSPVYSHPSTYTASQG